MHKNVKIFDTTLRDGEQTPGVSLTSHNKLVIAHQLDKLGVDIIEAGFPIASKGERESVKQIAHAGLNSKICGLSRVTKSDIDACLDCGVDIVHTFIPTSDIQIKYTIKKSKEEVLQLAVEAVEYIKKHSVTCIFSAMDATRTDMDYLLKVYQDVEKAGADIINVPDTVGVMVPSAMHKFISEIHGAVKIPIDVHCHNDFGLAVANTLAAVEAGAQQVQVTINGLGERAGNASLEETVMSLHSIYGVKTNIKAKYLVETSRLVERLSGIHIPPNTPVVGENAFSHESGIHTHGVLRRAETFEPGVMTPEMVGHRRRIVVGKHAGKHAVKKALHEAGVKPTDVQLDEIMQRIKDLGDKGKRVTDADLYAIAEAVTGEVAKGEQAIVLEEVSVTTGSKVPPTATIKAKVHGKQKMGTQTGVGPVDAALKAVQAILGKKAKIKLQDYRLDAITGGSDALAEVTIGVEDEKGNIVTARAAREDIVMASVEALVSAINRLMLKKR
ncbi:MAG: 2-isopropylmalate synthase [Methanosarcinales archaeon]|nr:MAG: 2-isopropylmalate synthase [Methanosarcinales archaeon]